MGITDAQQTEVIKTVMSWSAHAKGSLLLCIYILYLKTAIDI